MKNKIKEIKNKYTITELARRNLISHIAMNYLVLALMFIFVSLALLFVVRGVYIRAMDEGFRNKASEIANHRPFPAEYDDALMDDYYISYFDNELKYDPHFGNVQNLTGISFFELTPHSLNTIYEIEIARVTYKVLIVKTTHQSGYDGYVKIHTDATLKLRPLNSIYTAIAILVLVGVFVLIIVSVLLAILQIEPYSKAIRNSQAFTANVSHEISTPLAIVKTNLQNLLSEPNSLVSDVTDNIVIALNELERLQRLTRQLLTLSRSDDNRLIVNKKNINVAAVLESICEPYMIIAEEQDKTVILDVSCVNETFIEFDKDILTQLMVALLDNEIKYTRPFSDIHIQCDIAIGKKPTDKMLVITVWDNGDGVPDKELESIFMRFYRSDKSRNTIGSGLGLSIVHSIIKSLNGHIIASSVKPHGFKITMEIPIS